MLELNRGRLRRTPGRWVILSAVCAVALSCDAGCLTRPPASTASDRAASPAGKETPPATESARAPSPAPATEAAGVPSVAPSAEAVDDLPGVVSRLLPFDRERQELTVEYLRLHRGGEYTGDPAADTEMTPRLIVLHWTAGATADGAWNTFAPTRLSGRPDLAPSGAVNVSAHFLVDRDGTIYRLLPDRQVARHTIGLNHVSIGIENVGGLPNNPLTEAQARADADLVRALAGRHPITHLIGHHEYRLMEGHAYFQESDPNYRTAKDDPGDAFMARVRAAVADLGLQGAPAASR